MIKLYSFIFNPETGEEDPGEEGCVNLFIFNGSGIVETTIKGEGDMILPEDADMSFLKDPDIKSELVTLDEMQKHIDNCGLDFNVKEYVTAI